MEIESGAGAYGNYQRLENKGTSRHTSCTNVWLGLIFFATFLQMLVWVGAGVVGYMIYDANQENIQSWANLPWANMAASVGTSYTTLQTTPIQGTLTNAYEATNTVNKLLKHHQENTLRNLEEFVLEASNNKNLFQHVHSASIQLLPAIASLQKILKPTNVEDISVVLDKIRHNLELLSDDEVKKVFTSTEVILNTLRATLTKDNVESVMENVNKVASTLEKTLSEKNVNSTFKLINDLDKTVTNAEKTATNIGKILGKV